MSKVITTELQHSGASGANITLDSSKNVTCENNLTVDGTTTLTGAVELPDDTVDIADLSASGTASSSTFLRGDNAWAAAGGAFTLDGDNNIFAGTDAGNVGTWSGATHNFCVGTNAGTDLTSSDNNIFIGQNAGANVTAGSNNIAIGNEALEACVDGGANVAIGKEALTTCTSGNNVAVGYEAGKTIPGNNSGVFVGYKSGHVTADDQCTMVGYEAGKAYVNSDNGCNTMIGAGAGLTTTGGQNQLFGYHCGKNLTTGKGNTFVGNQIKSDAGADCTGNYNVAVGYYNFVKATSGTQNTVVGTNAGLDITSGDNNLTLGFDAGRSGSPSGTISSGGGIVCLGNNNINDIYCADTSISSSDQRDKTDITEWTHGLDWINKLEPITYRWDKRAWYNTSNVETGEITIGTPDGSKKRPRLHLGFKAQDVLAIEQADGYASKKEDMLLINLNEDDTAYGMKYERLVVVLTKAVQELSAEVDTLKTKVAALEAG